jgi:hypothetical protein
MFIVFPFRWRISKYHLRSLLRKLRVKVLCRVSESEGAQVQALEASLSRILDPAGAVGVAVVDAVTGFTYATVGDRTAVGEGPELSELANLIADRLCEAGAEGELESVVVTSTRSYHVTQIVPRRGDPVLLAAVLDRERTNLALAMRQMADHARAVLA